MARESRRTLGAAGEEAAAAWLQAHGYGILARNTRTRYGEIDLVARAGDLVVFVEVKSRTSTRFGHPTEAIAPHKRRRLARLAAAFVQSRRLGDCQVRFDAVAVYVDATGRVRAIEHVPDAFRADG
jgi:putative endonuclease